MIIIAGGGIAGLSLGWQLARRGEKVTLVEQHHVASGASGVASAYLEARIGSGHMRRLEWASVKAWPGFASDIEQAAGMTIDYRCNGQLRLGFADSIAMVKRDAETRLAQGWNIEWLEGKSLRDCEPYLSRDVIAAAFLPDVHWVDGRLLCQALTRAITTLGGLILQGQKLERILHEAGNTTGIATQSMELEADRVVLTCAMGTNDIKGLPEDFPRCRPVKGAMIGLGMNQKSPLLSHLLYHPNGHVLTPRSDGRLLVGSTHEDNVTSLTLSQETQQALRCSAIDLIPDAADLPVIETVAGIRALIGDGALRLGTTPTINGLYYSLSHAGAGFLRAPEISAQFADFIIDPTSPCPLIDRFLNRK